MDTNNYGNAPESTDVDDGFHVTDGQTANWVVRKIGEARQYAERVQVWAEAEFRRAKREEESLLFRFGQELEQWTRSRLAAERGRKSVALPAGRVGFRAERPRLVVQNENLVLTWCKNNLTHAVVVSEKLSKRRVIEHVEQTGDCPEGMAFLAGGDRFFVK